MSFISHELRSPRFAWPMLAALVLAALLAGCSSRAANKPNPSADADLPPRQIVERMAAAYRQAKAYHDRGQFVIVSRYRGREEEETVQMPIAWERFNRLRLELSRGVQRATFVSDGDKIHVTIDEMGSNPFDRQRVERLAPPELSIAHVFSAGEFVDPTEGAVLQSHFVNSPVRLELTPLGLLLERDPWPEIIGPGAALERLADEEIEGRRCFRVASRVRNSAADDEAASRAAYTLWIDAETFVVRQIAYPVVLEDAEADAPQIDSFVAKLREASFSPPPKNAFDFDPGKNDRALRHFVRPPDPLRADLIGKRVEPFVFTTLDDNEEPPAVLAGAAQGTQPRVAALLWFMDNRKCDFSLQVFDALAKKFADRDDVTLLAVCTEPTGSMSHRRVGQLAERMGAKHVQVVRDLRAAGRDVFGIAGLPTVAVLDGDRRVQFFLEGEDWNLEPVMNQVIEDVLKGEDIAGMLLADAAAARENYERHLAAADVAAEATEIEVPLAEVAPASQPQSFALEPAWTSGELESPGNMLAAHTPDGPRVWILDGQRRVAAFDGAGNMLGRIDLPLPEGMAASHLRTAQDNDGKRYFTLFGRFGKQAWLFDGEWNLLASYPSAEQKHEGIQDAALAVCDDDGVPYWMVAFWGDAGLHCVSLQGNRRWINRQVAPVYSVAASPANEVGWRSLMVTGGDHGLVTAVNRFGHADRPLPVGRFVLHQLAAAGERHEAMGYYCGLSWSAGGSLVAVGARADLTEAWSYDLPAGAYRYPVEPATPIPLAGANAGWLLSGADGSVHWIAAARNDYWNTGAFITGAAVLPAAAGDERPLLILASPEGVKAWSVTWP